jgi:hypothetical protein
MTKIKGVYRNIDYKIGLIDRTLDFTTGLKIYRPLLIREWL